jgi:signal transduction histidine kinase
MTRANVRFFPWHYFIRVLRYKFVLIVLTIIVTALIMTFFKVKVPLQVITSFVVIFLFSVAFSLMEIRPMSKILGIIHRIRVQMPHKKKLDIIYKKNEWALIQELLHLTEFFIEKQSEELQNQLLQSRTLIHSMNDPVLIIDEFQTCREYNDLFKDLFIRDKDISPSQGDEKVWKIFKGQEIIAGIEECIQNKAPTRINGHYFDELSEYYNISITALHNTKKECIGCLLIFHNVTKAKLNEKMRVDFVANVSHEIRTPLTSIKGYTQLLEAQKDQLPTGLAPILDKINNNSERLKDLFDNLLKLSVIESQYDLQKKDIDMEQMLAKISANLRGKYMSTPFRISSNFNSKKIAGDEKLIEQVINNLIDNAIKYGTDSPHITVNVDDSDEFYYLEISDNGKGIAPEELDRIFERFYRVQSTSTIDGTGLGLSIVKHIINKHGGEIRVESSPGEGTTFFIKLPH